MTNKIALVILTLLLAACQFQAHTDVEPDGAGELRTEVGFTPEERNNLIAQGTSNAEDFCNSAQQSTRAVTVTEEQRGGETWCVTTRRFDDLEELQRLYAEQKGVTVNRLSLTDEGFEYDVDLDTSSPDSSLSAFTAITWTVTLPGSARSHNATEVNGQTLTWHVTPKSGVANLRAESEVERPALALLNVWLLVLAAVGVVLLGIASVVLVYRWSRPRAGG